MLTQDKQPSGPDYKNIWDKGWGGNLANYKRSNDIQDLLPRYVKKNEFIRFSKNYILPQDADFESNFVTVLRSHFACKYFGDVDEIYEFGCGTGLNLIHISELLPGKKLWGFRLV